PSGVALQRICGGPPAMSIFFSLLRAKNPMNRLSGDQKGYEASSVPASICGSLASSALIQSAPRLPGEFATNATCRPSGDTASCAAGTEPPPAVSGVGDVISNRTSGSWCGVLNHSRHAVGSVPASATRSTETATIHPRRPFLPEAGGLHGPFGAVNVDVIHSSSRFTSDALCQRSSGSFARQASTTCCS